MLSYFSLCVKCEKMPEWEGWSQRPLLFFGLWPRTRVKVPLTSIILIEISIGRFSPETILVLSLFPLMSFSGHSCCLNHRKKCPSRNIIDCLCSMLKKLQMAKFSKIQKKVISNDVPLSKFIFICIKLDLWVYDF